MIGSFGGRQHRQLVGGSFFDADANFYGFERLACDLVVNLADQRLGKICDLYRQPCDGEGEIQGGFKVAMADQLNLLRYLDLVLQEVV